MVRKVSPSFLKCQICTFFFLSLSLTGCTSLIDLPVMGAVSEGVYTHPHGNFSCPLSAGPLFLGMHGAPSIVDAVRVTRTEEIPLSQRAPNDWRHVRTVSDSVYPSRFVKFEYKSGTIIEINSGKRIHDTDMELYSGMSGGVSWRFTRREIVRSSGRMVMGLLLVPWHEENEVYMGINAAKSYRQGQGSDARLWVRSNIVINEVVHTVTIKLLVAPLLTPDTHPRNLPSVRDNIGSRPKLQEALFNQAGTWLAQCHFSEDVK